MHGAEQSAAPAKGNCQAVHESLFMSHKLWRMIYELFQVWERNGIWWKEACIGVERILELSVSHLISERMKVDGQFTDEMAQYG